MTDRAPNRLAAERSPYLRQHARNPVDWYPWGGEAFARARAEQKPIFLSIGYSTCHWCHVMARESFEDAAIAAQLNRDFVPVKVDREERPDVDRLYMAYVQAATGSGGWPLSVWLTPELQPFYGGTYFPPQDRWGRPGFPAVLTALARAWAGQRAQLRAEGERVTAALRHAAGSAGAGRDDAAFAAAAGAAIEGCFRQLAGTFDPGHGGFGGAPKFPRAAVFNFLFRFAALRGTGDESGAAAVRMAAVTLRRMAEGGLHDHVGGGFHRYSVDEEWFVPHFEKMLYDQAQLAVSYLEARQATGDERFAWVARGLFDYVLRDLAGPRGGWCAAEDADSEIPETGDRGAEVEGGHAEGAFYLWSKAEIAGLLGDDAGLFGAHFDVQEGGNVPAERDPHGEFRGRNLLRQRQPLEETARQAHLDPAAASDRLQAGLTRLREARARRPRPPRDDKIIAAWNGLMISALAKGGQVLGEPGWSRQAAGAADFLRRELYDESTGILHRSFRDGRGDIPGFAEDYAYVIQGLLDLYEADFDIRWLQWAERLQAQMDAAFWDAAAGGYFNSRADDPTLIARLKEDYDGAEPAPGSVATLNLMRLAWMLGEGEPAADPAGAPPDYRSRARRCAESVRRQWEAAPQALPQLLGALDLVLAPPRTVVIAGTPGTDDFRALTAVLHERLAPRRVLLAADGGAGQRWLAARAPYLAAMAPRGGRATAYVCENFTCREPATEAAALRRRLQP
jgi:uncharacterized protein